MAGTQGRVRALAGAGEFRRGRQAEGQLERIERRALTGADDVHILITGAAGMIGRKLTERLAKDGALDGTPVDKLTLLDVAAPATPAGVAGTGETHPAGPPG